MVQTSRGRESATGGQDDLRPGLGRYRQAKENHDGLVEANDIRVVQPPHGRAQFGFGHGRNLVGHQPAGTAQSIMLAGFDQHPEQGRFGLVRRERTYGNRLGRVEDIVLHDDDRLAAP